ncbi:PhoX family phosphatase [Xylophilus sp. Leaf220]|uniref:PhoX family protein n=1 Tax=Xylophilus sp. Leaf220 TaxID=1735686 RepID=UPI0006FB7DCD|nr:PhoX family phosphatase [Xylophilus sp. Leaf220]KQM78012.1 phosphatase [Xylophilus sp. Leaf220]
MNAKHISAPVIDPDDIGYNNTTNPALDSMIPARLSRRGMLRMGVGTAGSALLGSVALAGCGGGGDGGGGSVSTPGGTDTINSPLPTLGFNAVAKSLADVVVVPAGYTASVLYRLGDPLAADVPAFRNDGTDAANTYDRRAGDHHDGMTFFGMNAAGTRDDKGANRGLLVMNHEAITPTYLHPRGQTIVGTGNAQTRTVAEEVLREFYLHGVSVVEVAQGATGAWAYDRSSRFNRRVHTLTPMILSGPAAGNAALVTQYSTDGRRTRGTVNNCANGTTPWGTYLTCEENWAGYFRRIAATDDPKRTAKERTAFARYGVAGTGRELWATVTPDTADRIYGRWVAEVSGASAAADFRNAANTYGWVVEIDPFTPDSIPRKRTALGRLGHEGACLGPVVAGQPLVWYMGDDSRNEYLYKFVSTRNWDAADTNGGLAAGDKYMDDGRLYVARFNADGSGTWLELKLGVNGITGTNATYAFADAADVLINARLAADVAGATKMDRPEWTAVNPRNGDMYLTLTNTNAASRPITATDAANPRFYNDPKGTAATAQTGNPNGHVIRLADTGRNPAATSFRWDVYLFGARSTASSNVNLSNLTADNDFSSPDGMWFSQAVPGLLWLETDDGAYTDVTNCMLLAAVPGQVGDGGARTVVNTSGTTTREQQTLVGAAPGTTLRRFLVGPKECEITGIAESGDGRAIFINVQHPGEDTRPDYANPASFGSHWPDGGASRPRSATVVITKNDGGRIGV